jgi:hypothetical protein
MEEKEARPSSGLEAGFQYVESETVNIGHVARANAGRKRERRKFRRVGLNDCARATPECMSVLEAATAAVSMKRRRVEPGAA